MVFFILVCISKDLLVCLPTFMSACQSVILFVCQQSVYLSVCLNVFLCVCLSVCLSVFVSLCLYVCLSFSTKSLWVLASDLKTNIECKNISSCDAPSVCLSLRLPCLPKEWSHESISTQVGSSLAANIRATV